PDRAVERVGRAGETHPGKPPRHVLRSGAPDPRGAPARHRARHRRVDAQEPPAMTKPPADALLFDLGGVVMGLDWDPMFRRWADASGVAPGELRRRWVHDEPYERHERGEIGEAEYF